MDAIVDGATNWSRRSRSLARRAVSTKMREDLLQRFWSLQDSLAKRGVEWIARTKDNARRGWILLDGRKQAFTIFLYSIHGLPNVRCVSPVAQVDPDAEHDRI